MMSAYGDDSCIEDITELKNTLSTQDLPSAINTIKEHLEQLRRVELNVGVTGESGSGKSSFVNAFRGLGDNEEGSAKTGPVETTMEPEVYPHPKYKNVKVWDLPGIGTPNFQAHEYLKLVKFDRYDFFIVIASDRFREYHIQLAEEIMRMGKKFYFVRSKIDSSIEAEKKSKNTCEKTTLKTIREDCLNGLRKIGIDDPAVFLIARFELGKYDFNHLQERMEKELPENKRHVLILALPNITQEINKKKKKALEKKIRYIAFLSACVAAIPVPFLSSAVDLAIIANEINNYYIAFGLDRKSLQQLCERFSKSTETVKSLMTSVWDAEECTDLILTSMLNSSLLVTEDAAESVVRFLPLLGSVAAGGLSYLTVSIMLKNALNDISKDAVNVAMALLRKT